MSTTLTFCFLFAALILRFSRSLMLFLYFVDSSRFGFIAILLRVASEDTPKTAQEEEKIKNLKTRRERF